VADQTALEAYADAAPRAERDECIRIARRLKNAGRRVIGLEPIAPLRSVVPVGVQLGVALAALSGEQVAFIAQGKGTPAAARGGLSWVHDKLAVISLPGEKGHVAIEQMSAALRRTVGQFAFVLVNLAGFAERGELLDAVDLNQGVVLVAPAGRVSSRRLSESMAQLPEGRGLGVLLVGGKV
jgi:hypothetical protein